MNWEKLGPNLCFALENKIKKQNNAVHISNIINEIIRYLKF